MGGVSFTGRKRQKHGLSNHWAHRLWCNMQDRVYGNNPTHTHYKKNGITIEYEPWIDNPVEFCKWADSEKKAGRWQKGWTLDRINNLKGYSPSNCRFTDYSTQLLNREPYGEVRYYGVYYSKLRNKYKAQILIDGKKFHIGYYILAVEGAAQYDLYVKKHGLPNRLNFPHLKFGTIEEFWLALDIEIDYDNILDF